MTTLTRDDIIPLDDYTAKRKEHRQTVRAIKQHRRIDVGPFVSFYFENRDTMWHQIQEMLYIEKGGEEQIADELEAYNPLIPQGRDLRCTMMIEIDDEKRRNTTLRKLGWIDEKIVLRAGKHTVRAEPLQETERNTSDGKTSGVHFLVFNFDDAAAAAFKNGDVRACVDIEHENYSHSALIIGATRGSLAADLA
ncbi:MAG: hypothetical protein CMM46_17050 [Rhodospirillaceae bacterium]|nr:hypothetical protein [Rhodospirillaceae bacterium]